MSEIFTENTLSDSYIFGNLNQNSVIVSRVLEAIKTGTSVSRDQLEEQFIQIQKTRVSPLWDKAVKAYDDGHIVLVYSTKVKVTSAVPFFLMRTGEGIKAFIFLNNYTGLESDGKSFDIPFKSLYVLMESAYLSLCYLQKKEQFTRNVGLMRLCMNMYTAMFTRILNKEYALTLDESLNNQVTFSIAKFFLTSMWGLPNNDIATNYASLACLNPDGTDIKVCDMDYNQTEITDLVGLSQFIKTRSDRMSNLTLRYLMERWINTYKQGGLLAMDCLPYLFFAIENLLLGTFLVNQTILRDIMRSVPSVRNFYAEIGKIIQ